MTLSLFADSRELHRYDILKTLKDRLLSNSLVIIIYGEGGRGCGEVVVERFLKLTPGHLYNEETLLSPILRN